MLKSLHISNYALIDRIDIDFADGLNIITGETGAGKSIMLGALSLILGGRADTRVVTDHTAKSVIEARFDVSRYPALKQWSVDNDVEWDDTECILRREISPTGRSRAFINDSPVPLARLQGLAIQLIDIHSQHQNQLLARPDYQLHILDTLAGNADRLARHESLYGAYRAAMRRLKQARAAAERERDEEEYTRFQYEQLHELQLVAGEQAELEQRREVLTNLTEIKGNLMTALDALADGHAAMIDRLSTATEAIAELADVLPANVDIPARLDTIAIEAADIVSTLRHVNDNLNADPDELATIEDRLNAIYSLEHKHRVDTVEALIELHDKLAGRLSGLEDSSAVIADLEMEARRARALARESAAEITAVRTAEAEAFSARLIELASPLGMRNLRVEMQVVPADLSATGADSVRLMVAFNKNQALMPVGDTASGGEISRLMLCIKSIVASRMQLPSIIFDEIDTGVSGDVAHRMGAMMLALADNLQVTAITHLPQVAAKGQIHFKVYKEDDDTSTHTRLRRLSDDERVAELAVMLSGENVTAEARANARRLLSKES